MLSMGYPVEYYKKSQTSPVVIRQPTLATLSLSSKAQPKKPPKKKKSLSYNRPAIDL